MMIEIIISYQQDRKDGKYDGYDVIDCMNFSPSCQSKMLVLFTYIIYLKILDVANLHNDARRGFRVKAKKYGASLRERCCS